MEEDGFRLGQWVATQRRLRASGKLEADRQRSLEALPGWIWNKFDHAWDEGFAKLGQYVRSTGDARVAAAYVDKDGFRLGQWVSEQRKQKAKGMLDAGRQRRLEELAGWVWKASVNPSLRGDAP